MASISREPVDTVQMRSQDSGLARSLSESTRDQDAMPDLPTPSPMIFAPRLRSPQEATYREQQARRKAEAASERERIRARIEADKQERESKRGQSVRKSALETSRHSGADTSHMVSVQVRFLDGTNMRKPFHPTCSIRREVRRWIDERRSESEPYTLKAVLTPLPSRPVSDFEEKKELRELGLGSSLSLVSQ